MATFSLRRYDTQARASMIVSLVSLVALCGLAFIVFQNLDPTDGVIYYGANRKLAILGGGAITLLLSAAGFGLGLNSAGQRRNDKPLLSWIGFFLGASVLCLTLIMLFFFRARGESAIN